MTSSKPYLLTQLRNDFEVAQGLGSPLLQCQGMLVFNNISGTATTLDQFSGGRLLIQSAPRPMVSNFDPAEAAYAGGFVGVVPSIPNTKFSGSLTMIETEKGSIQALAEFIVANGGAVDATYYDGRLGYFHKAYNMLNMAIRFESSEFSADSKSNIMTVTCPVDYNYFGLYADIGEDQTVQAGQQGNESGWHKEVKNVVNTLRTARNSISGVKAAIGDVKGLMSDAKSLFG